MRAPLPASGRTRGEGTRVDDLKAATKIVTLARARCADEGIGRLLPNLPQPQDRLPQRTSEAGGLVMRDASQWNELCIHTGFLKFRNSRLRRVKRHDLVVAGMNRQNRKPPP